MGYLDPHTNFIVSMRADGASAKAIARALYDGGIVPYYMTSGYFVSDRDKMPGAQIETLAASVRNLLNKHGLLDSRITKKALSPDALLRITKRKASMEKRLRDRPSDLGDEGQRDRWHVWTIADQWREFTGSG